MNKKLYIRFPVSEVYTNLMYREITSLHIIIAYLKKYQQDCNTHVRILGSVKFGI